MYLRAMRLVLLLPMMTRQRSIKMFDLREVILFNLLRSEHHLHNVSLLGCVASDAITLGRDGP